MHTPRNSLNCGLSLLLYATVFLLLAGCSSSKPDPSEGRRIIEDRIQKVSNGLIRLVSFEKTDGQQKEAMGVKVYTMDFKIVIEFLEDCMWGGAMEDEFSAVRGRPKGALDAFSPQYAGKRQATKGQRATVSGQFVFERTERGWRLVDQQVGSIAASDAATFEGNAALTQNQLSQLRERTEKVRGSNQTSEDKKGQQAATPGFPRKTYRSVDDSQTVVIVSPNELQLGTGATFQYSRGKAKDDTEQDIEVLQASGDMGGKKQQITYMVYEVESSQIDWILQVISIGGNKYARLDPQKFLFGVPTAYEKEKCSQKLKAIGLAFRTFAASHADRFPFGINSNEGGSRQFSQRRQDGFDANGFRHFQVMSKELVMPTILVCPSDSTKDAAASWAALSDSSVSYLIRSDPKLDETRPSELLVRCPVHQLGVLCDGSVSSRWMIDDQPGP